MSDLYKQQLEDSIESLIDERDKLCLIILFSTSLHILVAVWL